jgi:hypothetical protein
VIDLASVQARLTAQAPVLKLVEGSASFDRAVTENPTAWPAAFVFPLRDTPAPSQTLGIVEQRVTVTFGIALVVQNVQDARGDAAITALQPVRAAVLAALLGWSPNGAQSPVVYAGGRWISTHNGFFWWQDDFSCAFYLRSI